jgi:hypothetical protein
MKTNHLDEAERLDVGRANEAAVLRRLLAVYPTIVPAQTKDDVERKIDAWVRDGNRVRPIQVKWRESGGDLGVAIVRPYVDHDTFVTQYLAEGLAAQGAPVDPSERLPRDRDFKGEAELYVYATPDILVVVEADVVKRICEEALCLLAQSDGFIRNLFWVRDGVELRLVTDAGRGYSGGQRKIICYISSTVLLDSGAVSAVTGV